MQLANTTCNFQQDPAGSEQAEPAAVPVPMVDVASAAEAGQPPAALPKATPKAKAKAEPKAKAKPEPKPKAPAAPANPTSDGGTSANTGGEGRKRRRAAARARKKEAKALAAQEAAKAEAKAAKAEAKAKAQAAAKAKSANAQTMGGERGSSAKEGIPHANGIRATAPTGK